RQVSEMTGTAIKGAGSAVHQQESAAAQPTLVAAAVVPIRTALLNHLEDCQRDLASFVVGVIGARGRELTLARIWEGFFASPQVRAALDEPDTWQKVADLLAEIEPLNAGQRAAQALTEPGARFDENLDALNAKIDAARYENADPQASA